MNGGKSIRTATMARILAQQGHHRRAVEIYRYLLQQDPSRTDLARDLEALERSQPELQRRDPANLLAEWIQLLLRYRRLRELESIRERLRNIGSI